MANCWLLVLQMLYMYMSGQALYTLVVYGTLSLGAVHLPERFLLPNMTTSSMETAGEGKKDCLMLCVTSTLAEHMLEIGYAVNLASACDCLYL